MIKLCNFCISVNDGDYIKAVLDRNVAENITRVLYPNDNVSQIDFIFDKFANRMFYLLMK